VARRSAACSAVMSARAHPTANPPRSTPADQCVEDMESCQCSMWPRPWASLRLTAAMTVVSMPVRACGFSVGCRRGEEVCLQSRSGEQRLGEAVARVTRGADPCVCTHTSMRAPNPLRPDSCAGRGHERPTAAVVPIAPASCRHVIGAAWGAYFSSTEAASVGASLSRP
jgi:hypothetical protein